MQTRPAGLELLISFLEDGLYQIYSYTNVYKIISFLCMHGSTVLQWKYWTRWLLYLSDSPWDNYWCTFDIVYVEWKYARKSYLFYLSPQVFILIIYLYHNYFLYLSYFKNFLNLKICSNNIMSRAFTEFSLSWTSHLAEFQ